MHLNNWNNNITNLAGRTKLSNSVAKCLLIIFFDWGIPRAVAIVSAENEDSNTTRAPCTPLSVRMNKILSTIKIYRNNWSYKIFF